MNLLNQSLKKLSLALFAIISIWAVIFYWGLLDEIYDSLDDGLDNARLLIVQEAQRDSTVLTQSAFDETNYSIREIPREHALLMKDIFKDTLMYMQNEDDLEPVRLLTTAFKDDGRFYKLKVMTSMVEEDDLMESFLWGLGSLYIIILLAIFLINNILFRRLWKPFYKILHQLKIYKVEKEPELHDMDTRVNEFAELKAATDSLFTRIRTTFENQKQFIENAAHELQTPLATAINKLELLLENENMDEAQVEELVKITDILQGLTRFNKSLLLLSRIENRQFLEDKELSMNEVVALSVENLRDFAEHKKLNLQLKQQKELKLRMHPDLARIMVGNLVTNAIVHNHHKGMVEISLTSDKLIICNTGRKEPLDSEKIFQRFYKETTPSGNTGLGLAIAKAIADLYGFGLSYHYDERHCLELQFKRPLSDHSQFFPDSLFCFVV